MVWKCGYVQVMVGVIAKDRRYGHVQGNLRLGQYFIEVVFVDAHGLAVFQGDQFAVPLEVAGNQSRWQLHFRVLVACGEGRT